MLRKEFTFRHCTFYTVYSTKNRRYLVLDELVGSGLEQHLGDPRVSVPSGDVERRLEILVLRVHADVQRRQELRGRRLAIAARHVQGSLSLL